MQADERVLTQAKPDEVRSPSGCHDRGLGAAQAADVEVSRIPAGSPDDPASVRGFGRGLRRATT